MIEDRRGEMTGVEEVVVVVGVVVEAVMSATEAAEVRISAALMAVD